RDDLVTGVQTCALPIWGNTEAHVARGQRPESAHRLPQLSEALTALRGIGPEHLLIVDPPSAQSGERLERRAGTPRVRDARDPGGPCVTHTLLGGAREFFRSGGVLHRADLANPPGK